MRLLTLMVLSTLGINTAAAENPGTFTFLGKNQCAPFEGVLFDPAATAQILAHRTTLSDACEVRLNYELGKQTAEHTLELETLTIRHDALLKEYVIRVDSLERESDALASALKKQSNKRPGLWFAIGTTAGIALAYGFHKAFDE